MWHPKNIPLIPFHKTYKAGQSPFEWKIPLEKILQGGTVPPPQKKTT